MVTTAKSSSYYLGSLDGLRLLAVLAVFFNHLPSPAAAKVLSSHGWVGVELFFVISAFLLFRLLDAEEQQDGQINIGNFYRRRVLRIYPLLIAYYSAIFIIGGGLLDGRAWFRFAATLGSMDNIATWWLNYNLSVPGAGHLWTLSFEFQVYLILPFVFLAWRKWGTRRFLWGLVVVEVLAFAGRLWAVGSGAEYPSVYVVPYLRPESILLGLALAVSRPTWHPAWSALVAVAAGLAFISMPPEPAVYAYLPAALMVAALMDTSLRLRPLRTLLSWRPIRYLGTISFGLYVFHVLAIATAVKILQFPPLAGMANRPMIIAVSLMLTIVTASISYRYLERPFLRLKQRFESVDGRAVGPSEVNGKRGASPFGVEKT